MLSRTRPPHGVIRLLVATALLWTSPLAAPSVRADLLEEDWLEIRSPNFSILSRTSERKTRQLALDLELFRQVAIALSNVKSVKSPIPIRILVVDRPDEMRQLGFDSGEVAGFHAAGLRDNQMVVRDFQDRFNTEIIQHEYVHFLQSRSSAGIPPWYREGFAEFLSSVRRRGDKVDVGRVPYMQTQQLDVLTWVPIRRVIDPDGYHEWPSDERAMFYAEAWVLVHYLVADDKYRSSFKKRLGEYLTAVEAGESSSKAFEAAFDVRLSSLDRDLRRYVERGRFRGFALPAEKFDTGAELVLREPSKLDVALALGRLQQRLGNLDSAESIYARAVADYPKSAVARAGWGTVLTRLGRFDAAEAQLAEAVASAPNNPLVHLDQAALWMARAGATDDTAARGKYVDAARRHYALAWKLDKSAPETYAKYGESYLVTGDDTERGIEMLEEARRILPSEQSIRVLLAEAYRAAGRDAEAEASARLVLARSHRDNDATRRARAVLVALAGAEESGDVAAGASEAPAR